MGKNRDHAWLVLPLFFCSGATALVYEVVWSKYLSQMFGSTIQAQTVVLAVFMGGLALGNQIFGGKADQVREPVRLYGFIELAIGLYAFFFTSLYHGADGIFVRVGSAILDQSGLLLALKGVLSCALLLVPTILMGGTLPLLAAWLQKNSADAGRRSARFYSVNSLGAVFGAGLAGFYLVKNWGMTATLQITALGNLLIGGMAIVVSRQPCSNDSAAPEKTLKEKSISHSSTLRRAGALVAVTGGVSMGLEVLASRALSLIFGSSLQSFAIVLMAFILGIGLGSAAIASPRLRRWQSEKLVVLLLVAAAAWISLLVFKIDFWVDAYRLARAGLAKSTMGYVYHQILASLISMIILGLPAAMLGAVLPLLIRTLADQVSALGEKVGRLLTWNTLGAVSGVLLTGFVIMPHAGLRNSFGVLAGALCLVAMLTAWRKRLGRHALLSGAAFGLVLTLFLCGGEGWRHVMSSGVFRARETEVDLTVLSQRKKHITIDFYEDAPDATVSVEHGDGIGAPADIGLRINGKTDASTRGDLCTQLLVGHLPMLARPGSKDIFILGLGSGITAGAILGHPVEHLTVAENCEPVVRAAKFFEPWNRGVLTNRLTKIWREDARTVLKLSPQKYDVIITQPSNPWMVGVGSVFSREYYELAASRLKEGGIMAQWFHLYDMHDGIVGLVLRTFGTVFPHMEVWDSGSGDVVLLGSLQPWPATVEKFQIAFDRESPRKDLQAIGIRSAGALLARQLASQRTAFAIAGDGPVQSDVFPVLEYEAPRALYIGRRSTMLAQFDERTWQQEIAPKEKSSILGSLTDDFLKPLFSTYATVNEDLIDHLNWRFRNAAAGTAALALDPVSSPCVFRLTNAPAKPMDIPSQASTEIKTLLIACDRIERKSDQRNEGVDAIEELLRSYRPGSDWSAAHYASLAARASLSDGNVDKARSILDLALHLAPADLQLAYLSRIVAREEGARRAQMSSLKLSSK